LRSIAERCTPQLSFGGGRGGGAVSSLAERVEKLIELEEALAAQVLTVEQSIAEVEEWINALPAQQAAVMRLRYVDGLSWREVAARTHYSMNHVYKINMAALKKSDDLLHKKYAFRHT
jgi:DNA-directed RNA polymerase specialized sigma24 family protein